MLNDYCLLAISLIKNHLIYLQTNRDAHGSVPGVQQHPSGQNKRAIVVGGGGGGGGGSATSVSSSTTSAKQHGLSTLRKWTARPTRNGFSKGPANCEDSHRESHSGDTGQQQQQQGRSSRTNSINGSDMSMLQLLAFVIISIYNLILNLFLFIFAACCVLHFPRQTHHTLSQLTDAIEYLNWRQRNTIATLSPVNHFFSLYRRNHNHFLALSGTHTHSPGSCKKKRGNKRDAKAKEIENALLIIILP